MADVALRTGGPGDRADILEMADECLSEWGRFGGSLTAWLSHPSVRTFVAERQRRVVGFLMVGLVPVLGGSHGIDAEVLAVAVRPALQRHGLGRVLMDAALSWIRERARALPIRRVGLTTAVENAPAQELFRGFGFEVASRRRRYYAGGQDAFRMVLRLGPGGRDGG